MKPHLKLFLLFALSINSIWASNPINQPLAINKTMQRMDGWRLGVGLGYAFYIGDQMDMVLTRNYGDFNELRTNLTLSAFKQLNQEREWGLVLRVGSFQSLKSSNTQGIQCNFQELQSVWQRTLNDNIDLLGKRATINVQYGFGAMFFKSQYFAVNPNFKTIDYVISSVGYGYDNRTNLNGRKLEDIPNKKFAAVFNLGLNLGIKISRNLSFYWENSINISSSNKLSGNIGKQSLVPPDSYFYSGVNLFYKFGMAGGRLTCPKVRF
ncbi:MAG: hypothetical protein SGJ00_01740 [bacterium]|nr:hypothetical protein [bacterium]